MVFTRQVQFSCQSDTNPHNEPMALLLIVSSYRLNHELSSEPSFPAPQLYLLRYTFSPNQNQTWPKYISHIAAQWVLDIIQIQVGFSFYNNV